MASYHEHSDGISDPILPCCAAHLGISMTNQVASGTLDGADTLPVGMRPGWKEMPAVEISAPARQNKVKNQSDATLATMDSQAPKSDRQRDGKAKAVQKEVGKAYKKSPRRSFKPAQTGPPDSKKTALQTTTNKVPGQNRAKAGQNPQAREGCSSDDAYSRPSSDDEDKPSPKKSARKSATNKGPSQTKARVENHSAHQNNGSLSNPYSLHTVANGDQKSVGAIIRFEEPKNKSKTAEFGSITLMGRRRVQFCGFSDTQSSQLGREIAKHGGRGIEKERKWGLGYEFKLIGDPWGFFKGAMIGGIAVQYLGRGGIGDGGATREENFLLHMFSVMQRNGYSVFLTTQNFKNIGTFFFEKSPEVPKESVETMSISFHNPNRLRLTSPPREFVEAVEKLLKEKLSFRGERKKTQKEKKGEATYNEYKIPGLAWNSWHIWYTWAPEKRKKVTKGREIKLDLMKILKKHGWKPVASIDRGMRSSSRNEVGTEHVGSVWYYSREKSSSGENQVGFAGSMLQKVVGERKTIL